MKWEIRDFRREGYRRKWEREKNKEIYIGKSKEKMINKEWNKGRL